MITIGALTRAFFGSSALFANMANLERQVAIWMGLAIAAQLGAATLLLVMNDLVTRVANIDLIGTAIWNVGLWIS